MLYALIDTAGTLRRYEEHPAPPPALNAEKGLRWLAVEDVRPEPGDGEILEGPAVTVEADKVVRTWAAVPAPPPPVPAVVSMAQARVALVSAGLLTAVDDLVTTRGDDAMRQAWEYGSEVSRGGAMVAAIARALGWDDAVVDDLFRAAAAIKL